MRKTASNEIRSKQNAMELQQINEKQLYNCDFMRMKTL